MGSSTFIIKKSIIKNVYYLVELILKTMFELIFKIMCRSL